MYEKTHHPEPQLERTESGNPTIPFEPVSMATSAGINRWFVSLWLVLSILIVLSGALTRLLEWTGIQVSMAGVEVYLTFYIPMLLCIPMVMWFGYWWAAIPAYFSTFIVALIGGMPIYWIIIFSFANPFGLAIYNMFYRVSPIRTDMRQITSVVSFVIIALVASLASSAGAFVWAYTNKVGINEAFPVWQGWWLGGLLQAIVIVIPFMYFFAPVIERLVASIRTFYLPRSKARRTYLVSGVLFLVILLSYVGAARFISISQVLQSNFIHWGSDELTLIQNLIDGLSYPLFIIMVVMVAIFYLGFRIVLYSDQALLKVNNELEEKNLALADLANRDPLSGIYNRRKVFDIAENEYLRAQRAQNVMSIMMIDADRFKLINDNYGHLVGDDVIKTIAQVLNRSIRPYDALGRYGGEEFIVVLPDTKSEDAKDIAERICDAMRKTTVGGGNNEISVTVSIGVSCLDFSDETVSDIVNRADQALLKAKSEGRDRVMLQNQT